MSSNLKERIYFIIGVAFLILVALLMLFGCATPRRVIIARTWSGDGDTTRTEQIFNEEGFQLFFGERHDAYAGPGIKGASEIGKTELGLTGRALIGAGAGLLATGGNPAGGAAGAVLGAASRALDKPTTGTTSVVKEALK